MIRGNARGLLERVCVRWLDVCGTELSRRELLDSAMVFSPHPDDETLGCGATLAHKTALGAKVTLVVMTDGARSHARFVGEETMRVTRAAEALRAAEQLGIAGESVVLLGFRDGTLLDHRSEAVEEVRSLLERHRPEQVFIPHRLELPRDHAATREVVLDALRGGGRAATVLEYPVWYWAHWPWVPCDGPKELARAVRGQIALFTELRCRVPMGERRERKAAALRAYASQVDRPDGKPDWPTLGQVAGGDFLRCFFGAHELVHRYRCGSGA